ncbi:hypothetical protein BV898_17743 [Hypsibius exemplaris]|uniref:Uncharacterized protein n=1 Tax=Hypsibius exemplaris TaxID=2072580 RepID=A0A9X6NHT2_HYPEX|nr:hypothetical protein BV898_17743 [Hypsibius exemplaris]
MLKGSLFLLLGVCLLIAECVTGDPIGAQIGRALEVKKVDSDGPVNRDKRSCGGFGNKCDNRVDNTDNSRDNNYNYNNHGGQNGMNVQGNANLG